MPAVTPVEMAKCCATLHAIAYKYFGLNTVQMNRCVRSAVHASMTASNAELVNKVCTLSQVEIGPVVGLRLACCC